MSPITTHVLDTALGSPAKGVVVRLYRVETSGESVAIGQGVTNSDGRVVELLAEGTEVSGAYRLEFETGNYFASSGRESFYPRVAILFEVSAQGGHYHVPLLLSPYGYTTYRGS